MKTFLFIASSLLLLCLFSPHSQAQTVQEYTGATVTFGSFRSQSLVPMPVSCDPDTVAYPSAKATTLTILSVNTATSAQGLYQYYDCPQEVTVSGFDVFGFTPGFGGTLPVIGELYRATADSLPMGPPLASDTIMVDSTQGGLTLPEIRRGFDFPPTVMDEPYILVFINPNAQNFSIVCNDWNTFNGGFEWLSGADFRNTGGTWTRGYDVNVGMINFNADVLLHPYVSYEIDALYSVDRTCFSPTDSVNFTNFSSPIIENRMYNSLVFNFTGTEYQWNFGDGSATVSARNTGHTYTIAGPYTAVLTATVVGWASICQANYGVQLGPAAGPAANFVTSQNGANVDLTNVTSGGNSYVWDFGDGSSTSTVTNPLHFYTANGTYVISLTATNTCGTDTHLDTVVVNCDWPVADFSWTNSGLFVNFEDSSQNVTGWNWDFGDGMGLSNDASPNYIYTNFGMYEVTLIVTSPCGNDTISETILIADPNSITPEYGPEALSLFPNPSTGIFQLEGELDTHENLQIAVLSLEGKRLKEWTTASLKQIDVEIDLTDFRSGYYFLEIQGKEGRSIRKLAVIH